MSLDIAGKVDERIDPMDSNNPDMSIDIMNCSPQLVQAACSTQKLQTSRHQAMDLNHSSPTDLINLSPQLVDAALQAGKGAATFGQDFDSTQLTELKNLPHLLSQRLKVPAETLLNKIEIMVKPPPFSKSAKRECSSAAA